MHSRKRSLRKNLPGLALYLGAMILAVAACILLGEPPGEEAQGSLEGRFESEIVYSYQGDTLHYRQAALTNLLLLGIDRADEAGQGALAQEGGQADFLLLVTADREARQLTLTHIDRDTIAEIGTYGIFGDRAGTVTTQICLAHAFGPTEEARCENTVEAVSRLFGGIPIQGYIAMDMGKIGVLNQALGGVTVTLDTDFSHLDETMTQGKTITLTGNQAELFVRYRNGIADGSNESRMQRQRAYLEGCMTILESADSAFIKQLLDTMETGIETNLTESDLMEVWSRWKTYGRETMETPAGTHTRDSDGFVAFYPDTDWMAQYFLTHFFE